MKATSIKSSLTSEKKQELASTCELHLQIHVSGQNGPTQLPELTTTVPQRHQSEAARRFLLKSSGEFVLRDSETTLKRLAIQAVPFLADFCFFDVLATDGTIHRVSWAHAEAVEHEILNCSLRLSQHEAPLKTLSARSCAVANPSWFRKSTMPGCGQSPRVNGISSSCVGRDLGRMMRIGWSLLLATDELCRSFSW